MKQFTIALVLSTAAQPSNCNKPAPPEARTTISYQSGILTQKHDGHTYIIFTNANGVAMLHDPDCVCLSIEYNQ